MPGSDPDHWLHRFDGDEWLNAAANELARARAALHGKQRRAGVAQARRAAGMALNAVLTTAGEARLAAWGRSYMEHLQALARDESAPEPIRQAAHALVAAPLQTELVPLGPGDEAAADAAAQILEWSARSLRADG